MKRVLVATDLSDRSRVAVGRAVQLSSALQAELLVLHVIDRELPASKIEQEQPLARELVERQVREAQGAEASEASRTEICVRVGRPWFDILQVADEQEADLLVLGGHRDRGFRDLFSGTTIERVIRRGFRPLLMAIGEPAEPYREIMAGLDFSIASRRALEFTHVLLPGCSICGVHAYSIPFKGLMRSDAPVRESREVIVRPFEKMIHEELDAFLAEIDTPAAPVKRVLREGAPEEVLRGEAAKQRADLLVMGTHGRTGVARALLGSVTLGFLADPPCDVLVVKAW